MEPDGFRHEIPASHADFKEKGDGGCRRVFQEAKKKAKTKPEAVATDGLRAYEDTVKNEFFTLRKPGTEHIRLAPIRERPNNNPIERFHWTVRDRYKVMRGLDNDESAKKVIDGFWLYYNFLRPHMGLNGKMPAEDAGINLNLNGNKWFELIKQASKSLNATRKNSNSTSH